MSPIDDEKRGITRRGFIKGAAVGTAAVVGAGVLGNCKPAAAPTPEPTSAAVGTVGEPAKASFEIPPPPIAAKDIKETIDTEVVVLGAGIAGLTAALSAAEAGAQVILLEKGPTYMAHGLHNAALSSRLQKKAGIAIDRDEIIAAIMEFGSYRANQRIVSLWADNCDDVMNWLLDQADAAKIEVVLDPTTKPWYFRNFPTIHVWMPDKQAGLARMLETNARAKGVDIRYETPAARLIREGQGRVTGVIAQNPDGDYVQFNAKKAVVLCTGSYGSDREMLAKYTSWRTLAAPNLYGNPLDTGDGHKMALWIGAAIDDLPHCAMHFDMPTKAGFFNLGRQPWLYVNAEGERFMNEDLPWAYEFNQLMQQTGGMAWSVWDAKWDSEWPKMQSQCCKNMGAPTFLWDPKMLDDGVEKGTVVKADTIEELAQKMQVPVEAFKATVARYTELARAGKDLDYGKHPDRLTTLEKPPYYATQVGAVHLVTLGGLKVNTKLQVLDTERKVIPGLYAAGNVSGCFFGNEYPTIAPGLSHSRAWTFGRLAGLAAAAEKV